MPLHREAKNGLRLRLAAAVLVTGIVTSVPAARPAPAPPADEVLREDWLFQADGVPGQNRTIAELLWTEALIRRLTEHPLAPDLADETRRLADIRARIAAVVPIPELPPVDAAAPEDRTFSPTELKLPAGEPRDYTLACWIRTRGEVMDVLGTGVGVGDFLLVVNRGPVRAHHFTTGGPNALDGRTPVNDGRWHHIAQTVAGNRLSLYVDGSLDIAADIAGSPALSGRPVVLRSADGSAARAAYRFAGELTGVSLLPDALSAEAMRRLYETERDELPTTHDRFGAETTEDVYLAIRAVKRAAFMKHPAIDFNRVVFVDVPCYDALNHESMHRVFPQAQNNDGRLMVAEGLHPGDPSRPLVDRAGMFWRPDLSFDGKKVLFCMRPEGERTFHLYEMPTDGGRTRQITRGDYDDLDPIYLPDGNIAFLSNRGNSYARCAVAHPSYVVARCDPNGGSIYLLSMSNEPEYTPCLLPDGRILYTRWEYTDKELMRIQSLWTMNPDGTGVRAMWGNQSTWPDMLVEARPIPGSGRVMFSGQGHHDIVHGSIGIVDPSRGSNYPDGLTRVTWELPWAEVGNGPAETPETPEYHASGLFDGYRCPFPLDDDLFLVSARPRGDARFSLYLMDRRGNRELVRRGRHDILYAMPVRPRPMPPSLPDRVAWPGSESAGTPAEDGLLYSNNVLQGLPPEVRAAARYLRVIRQDYTTFTFGLKCQMPDAGGVKERSFHQHAGPPVTISGNDGFKRILGTVPIRPDGSVAMTVPPSVQLHFQILDDRYRALHTMRSFTGVMSGEKRGCVGCHEQHSIAPGPAAVAAVSPVVPTAPPWGAEQELGYKEDIQPILDRYCGRCHQGDGEARERLDLTWRPSTDSGSYTEPYVTLVLGRRRTHAGGFTHNAEGGPAGTLLPMVYPLRPEDDRTLPPMSALSYTSRLVAHATEGKHHGVRVDPLSARKLIAWVDLLCPFWTEADIRAIPDPDPKDPFFADSPYPPRTPGVRPFADSPYPPRMRNAPTVRRAYSQDEYPSQAHRLARPSGLSPSP